MVPARSGPGLRTVARSRIGRSLLTAFLALACAATTLGAVVTIVARPDGPHPGYVVVAPALRPLPVGDGSTRVLTGVHDHAAYAIEVPPVWNGDLVLYAHGFVGNGPELVAEPPGFGLRERLLRQGYAWAASSYDRNGYDVGAGVRSTAALAERFRTLVDAPRRTYLVGTSMGGHIAVRSIEEHPERYSGVLALCGALGDHALFDYRLDVQLSAQALAGVRAYPPDAGYAGTTLPQVYAGLGLRPGDPVISSPVAAQLRDAVVRLSGGPRPGDLVAFSAWKDFLLGLGVPDDGVGPVTGIARDPMSIAGNVGRDYAPDAPIDLDAVVQRVPVADEAARADRGLAPIAQVLGRPPVPVLALHDLGDLYVPFSMEQIYAADVAANGRSGLLVQRAIRATGHCEFSAAEVATAWDDLVRWVGSGERPAGDDVLSPAAVADPEYGCRFSDPAAYASARAPSERDTRRLYEPCPAG